MFGRNKAKVKVKKGRGPIRKVKYMIGAGTIAAFLPRVLGVFGVEIPEELLRPISDFAAELIVVVVAIVGYFTRPAIDDGVEVEG